MPIGQDPSLDGGRAAFGVPGGQRLGRLGRWCATHPVPVVAAWVLVLVLATVGHSALGGSYSDNFTLPSSPSEQGAALLRSDDPSQGGQGGQLVFAIASGSLRGDRQAIETALANVRSTKHVLSVSDPFATRTVSADGRTALATVHFDTNPQQLGRGYVGQIDRDVAPARSTGIRVDYGGALGKAASVKSRDSRASALGIVIALLVLLLGFGSVYAAGLPLISAGLATVAALGVLGMIAASYTFPTVSPTFAVMMGLGVGIDYALFLATRYRQSLIDGLSPTDAASRALATSGRAVLVAASTVIVALLSLYVSGVDFMGELGVAGAVAVAVGGVAALTLVPALLGLAGARIDRHRVRRPVAETTTNAAGWGRYAQRVGAHPWRFLLAGIALLSVLAVPFFSMQLGHVDAGADPTSDTAKRAYDEITAAFGPGANGPVTIAVAPASGSSTATNQTLETKLHGALAATPDVAEVGAVHPDKRGNVLVATVIPRSSPQDAATDTLQTTLRDKTLPTALAGTGAKGYVTGTTSEQLDFRNQITSRLVLIVAVVVVIAFLLLLASFRSPVLALKAAVLNLLSIGAAYGVIVAVFQWGWGGSLLGVSEKVPIESYVPMIMFAIVFGLSMDYEVFLLSRVREAWARTGDNHTSVAAGLSATARVITCAALIMTGVFFAFLLSTNVVIKMLALGLGASILIDATVIRLVVVPAAMFLLGAYNWWTPAWLDRLLPGGSATGAGTGSAGGALAWLRSRAPRHLVGLLAAALGTAVVATFAVTLLTTNSATSQTNGKSPGNRLAGVTATVGVTKVKAASLTSHVTLAGTVGNDGGAASITPSIAGTVTSLSITVGQRVTAGQTVATVSTTTGAAQGQSSTTLTVTAPIAGTIAQVLVPIGGYAGPTSPIATLAGDGQKLTAQASPLAVGMLDGHAGAKATASLAVPGGSRQIAATLNSIAPTASTTTQQTTIEFTTRASLQPGAPVDITVDLPQTNGPVVPSDAIVTSDGHQGVYVVGGAIDVSALGIKLPKQVPAGTKIGSASFTPIKTGVSEHGSTRVVSGLSAGEEIVTTGQTDLTNTSGSQRVAILPANASKARPAPSTTTTARSASHTTGAGNGSPLSRVAAQGLDVTVVSVHGSTLTVSTPIGNKSFTVPSSFHVTHDGKAIPLEKLHAGDVLKVTFKRVGGKLSPITATLQ